MLAKNSQAPRLFRKHALSLTFFASKLAPTEGNVALDSGVSVCAALRAQPPANPAVQLLLLRRAITGQRRERHLLIAVILRALGCLKSFLSVLRS